MSFHFVLCPWAWSFPCGFGVLLADGICLQVGLYLQQLAELELLLSEVRAGGGAESQELEGRMLEAEEMLQTILREALSLQGNTCPLALGWGHLGCIRKGFAAWDFEFLFSLSLLTSLRQVPGRPCGQDEGARLQLPEYFG